MTSAERDRDSVLPQPATGSLDDHRTDALLSAAGRGDESALGAFYDRTAAAVFGLLSGVLREPAEAEQATARVYLQLWRRAPQFDPAHGSAYSLLMRTARRELVPFVHGLVTGPLGPGAIAHPDQVEPG